MTKLLQILPRVPPAICGIGDYSWRLAQALRDHHDIHSSFLAAGTSWVQPEGPTEFPVYRLGELKASSLPDWLSAQTNKFDAIVLHMSPYGFQKRAVPLWLAAGWSRIASAPVRPRFITMFHELYASGPATTSAFWLQPLQKWILRRVAKLSDGLRTNREAYAKWLDALRTNCKTTVMPVFSNFGELANPPPLSSRSRAMISFTSGIHGGGDAMKSIQSSVSLCRLFELDTLHIIGGPAPDVAKMQGVRLMHQAFLPAENSSALLSSCRLAYAGYHPLYLAKSTIFAGFAAHGIAVVTRGEQADLPDGLRDRREVFHLNRILEGSIPSDADLQCAAANLTEWYSGHTLARNAESYARQIHLVINATHQS